MTKSDSAYPPQPCNEDQSCKPFVKWVGGKTQLLPEIVGRLPKTFNGYFEPFVGGGAVFFLLQPPNATLFDNNSELVTTYQVIKSNVEALILKLDTHIHDEAYFYSLRAADRQADYWSWPSVERASRLIYLNKTCYNGLYRVNSKGYFNTPFGDYKNPGINNPVNLRRCNRALQNASIHCESFLAVESYARKGDFVYFDPPYAPLNATSNFTAYGKNGFTADDQVMLRDLCVRLDHKGVLWMLSNSSASLILDLYKDFRVDLVDALRAINSKGSGRGKIKEVIVTNYS